MALPLQQEEEPSQGDLSRPNQTICTQISRIPLPADDCDRIHSMHAALSSLGAATTSFDAAMDSLLAASAHQRRRVQALERRMTAFRACLRRFDRVAAFKTRNDALDEEMLVLLCPGSYESALEGMDLDLAQVRAALDAETVATSTSNATRVAADAAVQTSLARDVRLDNGQAVPSDAWLDRASMGLGVGKALEATNQQRGIPLLLGETVRKGEIEYQHVLDTLVQHAAATHQDGFDRLEHLEESPGGDYRGDDESVYSVTSHMSTISVASSTRMTAGQRRRWHKQQSMKGRTKASATQMHPTLSTHVEASSQESAMAGRQQSLVGSHPYLCEVFHDSYGIGPAPAQGLVDCSGFSARNTRDGGTEFYPPSSHITDLLVFNTTKSSYGLAKAPTVAPKPKDAGRATVGTRTAIGRPLSPTSATSETRLAKLVFKTDAHAKAPALGLPSSLPSGLSR